MAGSVNKFFAFFDRDQPVVRGRGEVREAGELVLELRRFEHRQHIEKVYPPNMNFAVVESTSNARK